ncbi:hypothetical protein DB346_18040 [Verrucomicrobia bacterium LW23]|nr:hypothetical protein DB346_18040 [Verrucomicrobia bacterium LW23]
MSAKVIAFINFKGGVGKSSNVVNIGACLAHLHRRRVLLVDLDAQCSTTYSLLRPTEFNAIDKKRDPEFPYRPHVTTYQIFHDSFRGTKSFEMESAIKRGVPYDKSRAELIPLLDLLPASIDLMRLEGGIAPHVFQYNIKPSLRKALEPLLNRYDYILIDCPPNIYYIAQAGIYAADYLVVPTNPDYLSISAFNAFCELVKDKTDATTIVRSRFQGCPIAAVTINRYNRIGIAFDTAISELYTKLYDLIDQQVVHPQCIVLDPPIRTDVRMNETVSEHKPVILHRPDSIGAVDYSMLTSAFIKHFEVTLHSPLL